MSRARTCGLAHVGFLVLGVPVCVISGLGCGLGSEHSGKPPAEETRCGVACALLAAPVAEVLEDSSHHLFVKVLPVFPRCFAASYV